MSMEMRVEDQRLLVMRIHGILRRAELDEFQCTASQLIRKAGRVAALIYLDGFQGWESGVEWGDMSFLIEHDSDIEKIAIVGQERWRDEALAFTAAGLRRSPVRYFNDVGSARRWIAGGPPSRGMKGSTSGR